jgi:hypothetical protein
MAAGCSSSSNGSGDDASPGDAATQVPDVATPIESSTADATGDTAPGSDASDGGATDTDADASPGCPASWYTGPTVAALALPDGGAVILHAMANGTQDYTCTGTVIDAGADGGDAGESFAWTFVAPEAELSDCNATLIGHHFASEAGAAAPEWQTLDGTYVVGHKVAAYTPDGGSGSVPWLLLGATSASGSGTLGRTTYVQRVNTAGGTAPSTGCDQGALGTTQKVPYAADYYFFGP